MKFLFTLILFTNYLFSIDIGTLNIQNEKNIITQANDIKKLLHLYNIDLNIKLTNNSLESIDNIINNKTNNYFAIVNKDTIFNYNKKSQENKSIYSQIPAILSLGDEQIHIFTNPQNEFDFDIKKDYKVYCGKYNSNSCVSARYIQEMYELNFTYIKSNLQTIQDDLNSNKIDLFISVKKAPYKQFESFSNIKLIDLPTNFKMEDIYVNTQLKSNTYSFLDNDIHLYSVKQVLITNLKEKKYKSLINNIVKIIILNKDYLEKQNKQQWQNIDFYNTKYKKFLKSAKITIQILQEQKKREDALKF